MVLPLNDEKFFSAIGRLVLAWSHVECGLDYSVIIIHDKLNGKSIATSLPVSLSRKLEFLRKAAHKIPELNNYKKRICDLAVEIKACSDTRHDVVHGFLSSHPLAKADEAQMVRIVFSGDNHSYKPVKFTAEEVLETAKEFQYIASKTIGLAVDLMNSFAPKEDEKPSRKI